MLNLRKKLPPMTTLAAFEAAARTLSFTKAANELCITQAAISRKISSLENNLGVKLFNRYHRKIELTEHGQEFQHNVKTALDLIEHTTRKFQTNNSNAYVTIAADTSMSYRWLLPRFELFRSMYPDILVKVITSDNESITLNEQVDISLLYGSGHWQNHESIELIKEEIYPVAHPNYVEENSIYDLSDLKRHILLDLDAVRWDWVDWTQWLANVGLDLDKRVKIISFSSLPLMLDASIRQQGIALGWKILVDDLIENGSLQRISEYSYKTGRGYYLLIKANVGLSKNATLVYDWLLSNKSN